MNDKYITVSQLNRYIKYKFNEDENLNIMYLKGEISNFKAHTRGHYYFTLKDDTSRVSAIMFAQNVLKTKFTPEDGMKVLIKGSISVYEATGAYQIYVNEMIEDGVGALYIAFEQLKKKLEKEGLFQTEHKKKIPKMPLKIGIVTAPTGAAIKDILSTIKRRWPYASTILFPSLVQGSQAAISIANQIQKADQYEIDVLIIGRGGGSIEDMWGFNEEIVARAIYNAKVPIISAVGHEIDFTIADFVADLRAPTPTGAAEMAVPNKKDIEELLTQLKIRLFKMITNLLENKRKQLNNYQESYVLKNPYGMYQIKEQTFDNLIERLNTSIKHLLEVKKQNITNISSRYILKNPATLFSKKQLVYNNIKNNLSHSVKYYIDKKVNTYNQYLNKLEILNPLNTLKRGFSIIKKDEKIAKLKDLQKNDIINITMQEGSIEATIN